MIVSEGAVGPVEIVVVPVDEDDLLPAIIRALERQVRGRAVSVVDVVLASVHADGSALLEEVNADEFRLAGLDLVFQGLLSTDDVSALAGFARSGRRIMVIAFEVLWARNLASALAAAGVAPASTTLIPAAVVNAVVDLADSAGGRIV